jgi:hypothetical protein
MLFPEALVLELAVAEPVVPELAAAEPPPPTVPHAATDNATDATAKAPIGPRLILFTAYPF